MRADENPSADTEKRVSAIVNDVLRRRLAGENISDEAILAAHPELADELQLALDKARLVAAAAERAKGPASETQAFECGSTPRQQGTLVIRCPHCREPIETTGDTLFTDITCEACGSSFSLIGSDEETRSAPPLKSVGRFDLIERIGVGGFGVVWKGRDRELDRAVAIKIPRHGVMEDSELERFLREARAAAQLKHPNIVRVFEVGREGDLIYIVSDLVRGVTLDDWLTGQQPSMRQAAEMCVKIADALHHAHENGIIHRDLKPSNIMVDGDGEPHLMDFGLARREVGEVTMTIDGAHLGTPAYMSPEQAAGEGHTADRRTDIYSLGVILFELLTGERPFRGNRQMLMYQAIHDEPPSPKKLNATIPKDLETITLKCLEKEPSQRYPTAVDLREECVRWLNGEPILARPLSTRAFLVRQLYKHKSSVVAVLAFALTLITTSIISLEMARRANRANIHVNRLARETQRMLYVSDMKLALHAFANNRSSQVRELLIKYFPAQPEDFRGPIWNCLWNALHRHAYSLHDTIAITAVAIAPGGGQAAYATWEGSIKVWDLRSQRCVQSFRGPYLIRQLAFSPDGNDLIAGAWDGPPFQIWSLAQKQSARTFPNGRDMYACVAWSPDGTLIASGAGHKGYIEVVRASDGEILEHYTTNTKDVQGIAFARDGTRLIACGGDGFVVYDRKSHEVLSRLPTCGDKPAAMELANGQFVTWGSRQIMLWNADFGLARVIPSPASTWINSVAIAPNDRVMFVADERGVVSCVDLASGLITDRLMGHAGQAISIAATSKFIVSSDSSGHVLVWERPVMGVEYFEPRFALRDTNLTAAWKPDVKFVSNTQIASSAGNKVAIWNLADGSIKSVHTFNDNIERFAISPNRTWLAVLSNREHVSLHRLMEPNVLPIRSLKCGAITYDLCIANDEQHFATIQQNFGAVVHSVAEGPSLDVGHVRGWPFTGVYLNSIPELLLPDGSTGFGSSEIWRFSAIDGKRQAKVCDYPGNVFAMAVASNDRVAAIAGNGTYEVAVFDPLNGVMKLRCHGHTGNVDGIAIRADGSIIATASGDKSVRLWDALSGEELAVFSDERSFTSVSFSSDGSGLCAIDTDDRVRIWRFIAPQVTQSDLQAERAFLEVPKPESNGVRVRSFAPEMPGRLKSPSDTSGRWLVSFYGWTEKDAADTPAEWNNLIKTTPMRIEQIDELNFDWQMGSPSGVPNDQFALRAVKKDRFSEGKYELQVISDDGVRVFVDGKKVLENWTGHAAQLDRAEIQLSGGSHEIIVEYYENLVGAILQVSMTRKSGAN